MGVLQARGEGAVVNHLRLFLPLQCASAEVSHGGQEYRETARTGGLLDGCWRQNLVQALRAAERGSEELGLVAWAVVLKIFGAMTSRPLRRQSPGSSY